MLRYYQHSQEYTYFLNTNGSRIVRILLCLKHDLQPELGSGLPSRWRPRPTLLGSRVTRTIKVGDPRMEKMEEQATKKKQIDQPLEWLQHWINWWKCLTPSHLGAMFQAKIFGTLRKLYLLYVQDTRRQDEKMTRQTFKIYGTSR